MKSVRMLAVVGGILLCALGASCNEPRYELVAGSGELGGRLAYRLDRESGQVCAFAAYTTSGVVTDLSLIGCESAGTR